MPLRREPTPLLTPREVPALRPDLRDVTSVFNPGAARWKGREVLLLRVQTRGRTTVLLPAVLEREEPQFTGSPLAPKIEGPEPAHIYDPRLTVIDDILYAVCACDFEQGCALLTLRTKDFEQWKVVALEATEDQRNGVLFPEKIGGRYFRFERPNLFVPEGGPPTGSAITCSASDDLVQWERISVAMEGRPRRWDELIGSGPPPVKTRAGWLHIYHGVATHFGAANVYQAGVALHDLEEPWRVLHRGAFNILEPREPWELTGQVPNVVFPSGMIVEQFDDDGFATEDSAVRVYYGAADTVVGSATTTIGELIEDARFEG